MHVNAEERSIVSKLCYWGPPQAGKSDLIVALYNHFRATDGEHTVFEERRFAPREELAESMSSEELEEFVAGAESSMSASYEELVDSGTLCWFRTRLAKATADDQFHVFVDTFTVSGDAEHNHLRELSLAGADAVVFVADAREEGLHPTLGAWEALEARDWSGPILLFVNGAEEPDDWEQILDFEDLAFAEFEGFDRTLACYHAAAKKALQRARSAN